MLHAHSPHSHDGHAHGSHREAERGRLLLVMALTGVMMLVELVFGWLTNSLALIGDAGHMLTHFAALSVTFLAILLAARPLTKERTYGLYRAEILAALFNGVFVLLITLYIFYEAYLRFRAPVGIRTGEMLAVAAVGLVVNLAAAGILWGASREDLNVKSAFVHLIGDTLSSVGIIAAGIAIHFTGWSFLDPLVAVILGVVILFWGYQLIRDSVHVLLESVPKDISVEQLKRCVLADAPAIIGLSFGFIAGFKGGLVDVIFSRMTDLFLAFPIIYLIILILAMFGNSLLSVIVVLGLSGWMSLFKIVKSEVLSAKNKDYITTAGMLGMAKRNILTKEILPVILIPLIVNIIFQFSNVILAESALSYLGLGSGSSYPSWGAMIESGQQYITKAWWMLLFPGMILIFTIFSVNDFGKRLNKTINPVIH